MLMKHFLNLHARKLFFHAHIQSTIDYASTLWDNASETAIAPVIRTHKRAIKQILLKSSSIKTDDYKTLNILPFKQKLILNKAKLMYKIVNKLAPQTLIDKFPENEDRHNHNDLAVCYNPRVKYYQKSLQYSGAVLWNSLPNYLKYTKRLSTFKRNFIQYLYNTL